MKDIKPQPEESKTLRLFFTKADIPNINQNKSKRTYETDMQRYFDELRFRRWYNWNLPKAVGTWESSSDMKLC